MVRLLSQILVEERRKRRKRRRETNKGKKPLKSNINTTCDFPTHYTWTSTGFIQNYNASNNNSTIRTRTPNIGKVGLPCPCIHLGKATHLAVFEPSCQTM